MPGRKAGAAVPAADAPDEGEGVGLGVKRRRSLGPARPLRADVPRQKQDAIHILSLGGDMDLMPALPAKPGRIEATARRAGIFKLALEQDISGLLRQSGENLACAGDELVELEGQECTRPPSRPAPFPGG